MKRVFLLIHPLLTSLVMDRYKDMGLALELLVGCAAAVEDAARSTE